MYSNVTSSCNLVATFREIVSQYARGMYSLYQYSLHHKYVKIIVNLCISFFFLFSFIIFNFFSFSLLLLLYLFHFLF